MPFSRLTLFLFVLVNHMQCTNNQKSNEEVQLQLKAMTFNVWRSGDEVDNGIDKIVKAVSTNNPDIVFFQEIIKHSVAEALADRLPEYNFCESTGSPYYTYIFTKYSIVEKYPQASASASAIACTVRIALPKLVIDVFLVNIHLSSADYGPYRLCGLQDTLEGGYDNKLLNDVIKTENFKRKEPLKKLLNSNSGFFREKLSNSILPIIAAGDFNCPYRWKQGRCGIQKEFVWPAVKHMNNLGFKEAYDVAGKDNEGATWSPIYPIFPQDRIDFIFYRNSSETTLRATQAEIIATPPFDMKRHNEWPSDHAAVLAQLKLTTTQGIHISNIKKYSSKSEARRGCSPSWLQILLMIGSINAMF